MRVLYVEDNAADVELTRRALARLAPTFHLDVVDTVAAAIARLQSARDQTAYQALLLDLRLPDGDGLQVLDHARREQIAVAVVVLTGMGSEEMAVSALKAGADDYIAKRDNYLDRLPATLERAYTRFLTHNDRGRQPLHVLYVEHHTLDVDLTLRHLARHAPHIRLNVVHSADDALQRLAEDGDEAYDLLLLDYRLPALNALDLLKELDQQLRDRLPVVLVTGQGDEDVAVQALRMGAFDYLVKHPGYLFQLPRTLENAVTQARLRREQAALHASEARYRMLVDHAPVAIFAKDVEGRYTSANALTVRAFGRDPVGYTDFDLLPEVNAHELVDHDRAVMQTRSALLRENRLVLADGEKIYLAHKAPLVDAADRVRGVLGVSVEITERMQAEAERRENQLRFRQLAKHIDQIFWLVDLRDRRLLYLNPAFESISGYAERELYADTQLAMRMIVPEDHAIATRMVEDLLTGRVAEAEFRIRRKDGDLVWLAVHVFPIHDEGGALYRVGGLARDITQQRRAAEYAHQQERLVAVGQMAAGIAHDFNNVLAVIMLYTQMLQLDNHSPAQQRQLVTIYEQAQHAANLVQQILDFSRRAVVAPVQMDIVPFVKELARLWQRTLPESIRVELHAPDAHRIVLADPSRLQQALMNMAINARDAMPNGGVLTVSVTTIQVDEQHPAPLPHMQPGHWLALALRDTGEGMSPEVLTHMFEPFFTTKPPGAGTGLGLAQVYGIVRQMDGHIQVESSVGVGSCFTIYLALTESTEVTPVQASSSTPPGRGQLILLVEDETALRVAMSEMLTELGYRVVAAEHGRHAMQLLDEQAEAVDLVVSDLVMPEMGGLELFDLLRNGDDDAARLPVLLVSGYPLETNEALQREQEHFHWLSKPFTMQALANSIAKALQTTAPPP